MGNGALAPGDVARFWLEIGSGRLLSPASMKQMMHFQKFTDGLEVVATTEYVLSSVLPSLLPFLLPSLLSSLLTPPTSGTGWA